MTGDQVKRVTVERARNALRAWEWTIPNTPLMHSRFEACVSAFEAAVREDERERARSGYYEWEPDEETQKAIANTEMQMRELQP